MSYAGSATAHADRLLPASHPFSRHLRLVESEEAIAPHRQWTVDDGALPALFLSHGAPYLFEMTDWLTELRMWARTLPRPRGIVVLSAHWEDAVMSVSGHRATDLVYDFTGFDPIYSAMRYDTPEAPELADAIKRLMPPTESVYEHPSRGLDHGAWVPLKAMYPEGDIPVVQVSMPTHDPARLLELGGRLRSLRQEGILVVGSGFMTHGLPFIDCSDLTTVPGWSSDFDQWAAEALAAGDIDELAAFRDRAPGMRFAHPTIEHFTPMFVTLGAADDPTVAPRTRIDGFVMGLARRSFEVT